MFLDDKIDIYNNIGIDKIIENIDIDDIDDIGIMFLDNKIDVDIVCRDTWYITYVIIVILIILFLNSAVIPDNCNITHKRRLLPKH